MGSTRVARLAGTLVEVCVVVLALVMSLALQTISSRPTAIACTVTAAGAPVAGVEIVIAGQTYLTDRRGEARIEVMPGSLELTAVKEGFAPVTTTITVARGQQQPVTIEFEKLPSVQET